MPAFLRLLALTIETADQTSADSVACAIAAVAERSDVSIARAHALVDGAPVEAPSDTPSETADAIAGRISKAADAHEAASEEGMAFGDLEDALAAALGLMTPEQRSAFLDHWKVQEILDWTEA